MNTIDLIMGIVLIVCIGTFGFLCFTLIQEVAGLKAELEYYKSICSQTVEICEKVEKKLDKHMKESGKEKTRAYFQGLSSVRHAKSQMKNKNGSD